MKLSSLIYSSLAFGLSYAHLETSNHLRLALRERRISQAHPLRVRDADDSSTWLSVRSPAGTNLGNRPQQGQGRGGGSHTGPGRGSTAHQSGEGQRVAGSPERRARSASLERSVTDTALARAAAVASQNRGLSPTIGLSMAHAFSSPLDMSHILRPASPSPSPHISAPGHASDTRGPDVAMLENGAGPSVARSNSRTPSPAAKRQRL